MPFAARRPQGPEDDRLNARTAFIALLLLPLAAMAADVHPLLDFARERAETRDRDARNIGRAAGVAEAEHAIAQAHVPPEAECARTLGAQRYADLYTQLAGEKAAVGDRAGAAAAYRSAHACRPRDADILAALGGVLFDQRDYPAARAAIDAALEIEPRSVSTNRIAGNVAFAEERWPDAIARFRYVAASDPDRNLAGYGQLMYWLAQARSGVARPEFVARAPGEGWPQPLLLYMKGEYKESEVVAQVIAGDDDDNTQPNTSTDERLCEALYYVGEAHWARGNPEVARDYFAALVNIRVLYFLEHGLALAELAKLR
jgi:lipoprotein NlpI